MDELKDKGKSIVENLEGKRHELIQKWEDKSREFINNFLELFGRDGRLNNLWNQSTVRIKRALSPAPSPSGSPQRNGVDSESQPMAKHLRSYSPKLDFESAQYSDSEEEEEEEEEDDEKRFIASFNVTSHRDQKIPQNLKEN